MITGEKFVPGSGYYDCDSDSDSDSDSDIGFLSPCHQYSVFLL